MQTPLLTGPLLTGHVESPGSGGGGGGDEPAIDLLHYWHVLRKHRVAIAVTCLAVVAASVIATFLMRPVFRAVTTIQIERDNPNILSFQEILAVDSRQDDFYQTQYMLLQSRSLLRRVVEQLRLDEQPEFRSASAPAKGTVEGTVEAAAAREGGAGTGTAAAAAGTAAAPAFEGGDDMRVVDVLQRRITVDPVRRSRLVRIGVTSHDRELAAAIANQVASAYIDMNLQTKFETTEAATQFLSAQIENLKKEIEDGKRALQEYANKSKLLSLDDKQNITVQRLTDLNASLTTAEADRIEAEAGLRSLLRTVGLSEVPSGIDDAAGAAPRDLDLGRLPEVSSNQLVQTLRSNQAQLQTKYVELGQRFKPEWPEMVRLKEQLTDLQRQIRAEEWRIAAGLLRRADGQYRAALSREQLLRKELDLQRQSVSEMNSLAILYNTLKAEIDNKTELLDSLLKRKNETDVSARLKGLKSSNIRVVDRAEVPGGPFRPNRRMNVMLGSLVGLLLGVGVALFLEHLDNTVKSIDDIERYVGLPSLGIIPLIEGTGASPSRSLGDGRQASGAALTPAQQLVTLRESYSPVSEAYRSLRTSILLSAAGSPPRFLLVTSSQPNEGKTTTVVNTAIALSQAGKKVLLIDADLRKPRCHKVLALPNKAGLTTYLTGAAPLKDLIQVTPVKNLYVLPSGPIPPNPSELLGSERIQSLMRSIPASVNHILFDSPPVLTVTDAMLLATLVDGVVLVVRSGRVPRELLVRARKQLRDVNAKIVGVVLNSVDSKSTDYYYYRTYAYGYHEEKTS